MKHLTSILAITLLVCTLTAGCQKETTSESGKLRVVATIYPLAEFARQAGGDRVEVIQLLPVNAEPHHWEPSPKELTTLENAQVFIYNGANLEPWVQHFLPTLKDKKIKIIEAAAGLPLMTFTQEEELGLLLYPGKSSKAPAEEILDPHIWNDPLLAKDITVKIGKTFGELDPQSTAYYQKQTGLFTADLEQLHEKFASELKDLPRHELIVTHAAFGYLAGRYGLIQVPVLGLTPSKEPDAATIRDIIDFCRQHQVKAVFCESLISPKVPQTIAREIGAEVLDLNPLGGLAAEKDIGYLESMAQNLENLKKGLGGEVLGSSS